jgi:hypothetical protein
LEAIAGALRARHGDRRELALAALAIAAVAVTLALRILAAGGQPLTMDETFTGMIAGQDGFGDFIREARSDIAAPLYYTSLWLLGVGSSDFALRAPSWTFMIAGSALPLLWRIPGQPRSAAIAWAALLFLWLPGAIFAVQARPYALLFLVATAQTIAFARLIEGPTLRRAFAWTGCTSLTLLTHYFAAPLALAQGAVLVAVLGPRAVRLWPSLLLLLAPLLETVTHLPRLLYFASGDANWLPPITLANLAEFLTYGIGALGPVLLLIALGSRYLDRAPPVPRGAALAALAGAIALALLIAAGWHRSLLVDRYLTACAPALMLGLVTIAAGTAARMLLVAVAGALAIYAAAFAPLRIGEQSMEWSASKLIPYAPQTVVYSLGYKGQHTLAPHTQAELGAFLFRRAGLSTQARMVTTLDGRELVGAAGPDAAVVWVYYPEWEPVAEAIARERRCFVGPNQLACPPLRATRR